MNQELLDKLHRHISERSLLSHPFYQDWKDGKLSLDDLRLYAGQYYHFEDNFPRYLSAVHSCCPDRQVRRNILDNLWDEEHGDSNHRSQWLDFCAGLGMTPEEALTAPVHPKTQRLLDTYETICFSGSFVDGLSAIYAYESQVPDIAVEKLAGLRDRYGIVDEAALSFFQVHSHLDKEHSQVEAEAISQHTRTYQQPSVESALHAGLEAWWAFLDGVNELRAKNNKT